MAGEVPVANLYHPDWNDLGTLSYGRNGAGSRGRTDTQSLYAFDTLKFGAHFMVSGGVRIDHYKTDYLATAACNTEGTGTDSRRSEEHTSELQSLMRISYAVFCLKKTQNT